MRDQQDSLPARTGVQDQQIAGAITQHTAMLRTVLHRRYIDPETVRDAARRVVNARLAVRNPAGRGNDGLRLRFGQQAIRHLRPEPDGPSGTPATAAGRDDLLV
jgi:hypothetical protein